MERNWDRAINYLAVEHCLDLTSEEVQVALDLVWLELGCNDLPSGLDYFLAEIGYSVNSTTAASWLCLTLGLPPAFSPDGVTTDLISVASGFDTEVLISGLEMLWRRRQRSLSSPKASTNHINRAKHRALKMLKEDMALAQT